MNRDPKDWPLPVCALPEPTVQETAPLRRAVRATALTLLSYGARLTGKMRAGLQRPRVQFLMLHHVFRDEEQGFHQLLERLARHVNFISYSQAVQRVLDGAIDKPYAAISFDDGLASCSLAARILRDMGISACFFVCPSMIGQTDPAIMTAFCRDRLTMLNACGFLGWDDLERMAAAGHEIGAHSMTHANLATLDKSAMEQEIGRGYDILRQRFGPALHFAWPLGHWNQFTPEARDFAFATGFKSCASAQRGCHVAGAGPIDPRQLCVRRDLARCKSPVSEVLYFMSKNAAAASPHNNKWPPEYATASSASI